MCQTFLPELLVAKGTIINIGSVAAHIPLPFMSNYCASKTALYAYSNCLRVELAPLGVNVVYVNTGSIKTNTIHIDRLYRLEESSLWYPVRDTFDKAQLDSATTGMAPEDFARGLADRTIGRTKEVIWFGPGAMMCRVVVGLEGYLPFRLAPWLLTQMHKMWRIADGQK